MTARLVAKDKDPRGDTFERKTFSVSRLADFATISELTKQTGQPVENWPLVVVKELADNALDDAEKAGVAPEIEIVVTESSITVADHGPASRPPPSRRWSTIPSACRPTPPTSARRAASKATRCKSCSRCRSP